MYPNPLNITFDLGSRVDDRPAIWPSAYNLAVMFCSEVRASLLPGQLRRVNEQNKADNYSTDVCASHNYHDANMSMLAAFSKLSLIDEDDVLSFHGDDEELQQAMFDLWAESWDIAKRAHFDASGAVA